MVPIIKNLEFGGLIQEETESKENTERTTANISSLINTTINPPKYVYHYGKMINEEDKRYFRYEHHQISPQKIGQQLSPRDRKIKQRYAGKRLNESLSFGISPSTSKDNINTTEYTLRPDESETSQSIIVMIQKRNHLQDVKTQNQIYLDKSRIF